jgi:hypothetical protein
LGGGEGGSGGRTMSENQLRVGDVQVPPCLCGGLDRRGALAVQRLGHPPQPIAGHCVFDAHAKADAHHEDGEHRRNHRDPPAPAGVAPDGRVGALRQPWRHELGRIRRDRSPQGEKHLDELGVGWILTWGRSWFGIEVGRPEPVQELVISRHREHVGRLAELLAAEVVEDTTQCGLERLVWLGVLACLEAVVRHRATTPTVGAGLPDRRPPACTRPPSASAGALLGVSNCAISLLATPGATEHPTTRPAQDSESDSCDHRYRLRQDEFDERAAPPPGRAPHGQIVVGAQPHRVQHRSTT